MRRNQSENKMSSLRIVKKLSGRVAVDEFFMGGQKSGKRGRGADGKTIVAVAAER
jgi:hypothetical protein